MIVDLIVVFRYSFTKGKIILFHKLINEKFVINYLGGWRQTRIG